MEGIHTFRHLTNTDLIAAVSRYAGMERAATAQLIASLAEFDRRRLYLDEGFKSLFDYCREALRLSEHAAYGRIEAARAARDFPCVIERLEDGRLSLTNLSLLRRHLTAANHLALLDEVQYKRKQDVELIVARLAPKPDAASMVRKVPARAVLAVVPAVVLAVEPAAANEPAQQSVEVDPAPEVMVSQPPSKPAVVAPLAPERYKIQVTVDAETRDVLRQAQDLMRHTLPSGDPAAIISRALRVLVDDLLKKKTAATSRPVQARAIENGSRAIPAAVRREVWKRDRGECAFEGARGRCGARGALEYHHVIPYALGGEATAANIELRCRAHNAYQARLDGLAPP
jgi:hypothetical protein